MKAIGLLAFLCLHGIAAEEVLVKPGGASVLKRKTPQRGQRSASTLQQIRRGRVGGGSHRLGQAPDDPPQQNQGDAESSYDIVMVGETLSLGLEAVSRGILPWMKDPPLIQNSSSETCLDGVTTFATGLWKVVIAVIPSRYWDSIQTARAQEAWMQAFAQMADIKPDVELFLLTGEFAPINRAILAVLDVAIEEAEKLTMMHQHAELTFYFGAIHHVFDGLAHSFQLHSDGRVDLSLQAIWEAHHRAIEDAAVNSTATFLTKIDGILSQIAFTLIERKRLILTNLVCWKQTRAIERERPSVCEEGYNLKDGWCWPIENPKLCGAQCGGDGPCEEYCGVGKMCCSKNSNNLACKDVSVNGNKAKCSDPSPHARFVVRHAGENLLHGFYVEDGTMNGRPLYRNSDNATLTVRWMTGVDAWEMAHDDQVFYRSALNTSVVPFEESSWETVMGPAPPPFVLTLEQAKNWTLPDCDGPQDPPPYPPKGVKLPKCREGQYLELAGTWCLFPCDSGFVSKVGFCEQVCYGSYPEDGPNTCGTNCPHHLISLTERNLIASIGRRFSAEKLAHSLTEAGVDVERVKETMGVFLGMGRPFPEVECELKSATADAATADAANPSEQ